MMPYRDLDKKRQWEARHRPQRIARRRQLRQVEAAWKEAHPEAAQEKSSGVSILLPIAAGATLAAWSPPLAIAAGGLTVFAAVYYKKGWSWWMAGLTTLLAGLILQWNQNNQKDQKK